MKLKLELSREEDGRWIGEVPELPGVLVYGDSADEASTKAQALALHALADLMEHGELFPNWPLAFEVGQAA